MMSRGVKMTEAQEWGIKAHGGMKNGVPNGTARTRGFHMGPTNSEAEGLVYRIAVFDFL